MQINQKVWFIDFECGLDDLWICEGVLLGEFSETCQIKINDPSTQKEDIAVNRNFVFESEKEVFQHIKTQCEDLLNWATKQLEKMED